MSNNLVLIGWLGCRVAYLNISKEEAIKRFLKTDKDTTETELIDNDQIDEFKFDDEFNCYDAWGK